MTYWLLENDAIKIKVWDRKTETEWYTEMKHKKSCNSNNVLTSRNGSEFYNFDERLKYERSSQQTLPEMVLNYTIWMQNQITWK